MLRICKKCGNEFNLTQNKPGLSTTCFNCSVENTPRVAGITYWEGKHTPVLVLTDKKTATQYSRRNRRLGAGVMAAICPSGAETNNPGTKTGTGCEKHAQYISPIGEKHNVKD